MEPKDNTGALRIGTSGWSYPPASGPGTWTGVFYPLSRTDELKFYARFFNAVEINSTFYRPCSPRTAESWVKRTPDNFEFTVKVWQQFTHRKDEPTAGEIHVFKDGLVPLAEAGKLGCLLFQFPASFKAGPQTTDRLKKLLEAFDAFEKAVELRHQSWNDSIPLLESCHATPAFIDEPKFETSIQQEMPAAGQMLYLRLHGRRFNKWWNHEHRNERYDYIYSAKELRPFADRIRARFEQGLRRAYTFFNNHPGAKAVANAIMLRAELDAPVESELPERLVAHFPELRAGAGHETPGNLF